MTIDRIGKPGSITTSKIRRTARSGDAAEFSSALEAEEPAAEPSAAAQTTGLAGVADVSALLALQQVDPDGRQKKRRMVQHGEDVLKRLERLRDDLLLGNISAGTMTDLTAMVARSRDQISDARLNAILDEIELRALVELAKLEKVRQG